MNFSLRLTLLTTGLGIFLLSNVSSVAAVDCPSIRINDLPAQLSGVEILSNSAPLEFGVHLSWENPVDNKAVRTYIYRKEKDSAFENIGQVPGTQSFYVDKKTTATIPAYIYAVKSEFLCGGTLWSEPIVVTTTKRLYDTSAPSMQIVLPRRSSEGLGAGESAFIYVRDLESGIAEKLLKVLKGKSNVNVGNNLGTPQHALFKLPGTGLSSTPQEFTITSQNGAEKLTKRSINLSLRQGSKPGASWKSPSIGSSISIDSPLTITWSLGSNSNVKLEDINISYSTNFGTDWFPTEVPLTTTSHTFTEPQKVFKGINNASILWLRMSFESSSIKYDSDILPLFVSTTLLSIESPRNFVAKPQGDIQLYDAYKGTKLVFEEGTQGLQKDTTRLSTIGGSLKLHLKPGFYHVVELMDNFILDRNSLPAGVVEVRGGEERITVPFTPYSFFINDRVSLTGDGQQILSLSLLPEQFIATYKEFERRQAIKPVEPVIIPEVPVSTNTQILTTHLCDEQGTCTINEYTGMSPMKLSWSTPTQSFESPIRSFVSDTLIPLFARSLSLEVSGLVMHIPKMLVESTDWLQGQDFIVSTSENSIIWNFPKHLVDDLYAGSGFFKISTLLTQGEVCTDVLLGRRDASGEIVPVPTLCATDKVVGVLLPFGQTEILKIRSQGDIPILQGNAWYVPYMNQFQVWGMLRSFENLTSPQESITRGELAYLLHKSFQYPTGAYQGTKTFSDLPASHPDAPYILGMVAYGIMSGDASEATVRPEAFINRAETLKMIISSAHLSGNALPLRLQTSPDLSYSDVSPKDWFAGFIQSATKLGIVSGYMQNGDRTFKPSASVTRAEALKMIYAALERKALE